MQTIVPKGCQGCGKIWPRSIENEKVMVYTILHGGNVYHAVFPRVTTEAESRPAAGQFASKREKEIFMRLRNIPRANDVISAHAAVINAPEKQKGNWNEAFGNKHPIHIEIGMGKGQFLTKMAEAHPEINYVGIERYSSVLLRAVERYDALVAGAGEMRGKADATEDSSGTRAVEVSGAAKSLDNIRLICMDAACLADVFAKGEVEKIYLNFSDPWPKAKHAKRRLVSKEFLTVFSKVLASGGTVEFKTDNVGLFDFSLQQAKEAGWEVLAVTRDLHHDEVMSRGNVMTEYEEKFSMMGNPIHKGIFEIGTR